MIIHFIPLYQRFHNYLSAVREEKTKHHSALAEFRAKSECYFCSTISILFLLIRFCTKTGRRTTCVHCLLLSSVTRHVLCVILCWEFVNIGGVISCPTTEQKTWFMFSREVVWLCVGVNTRSIYCRRRPVLIGRYSPLLSIDICCRRQRLFERAVCSSVKNE